MKSSKALICIGLAGVVAVVIIVVAIYVSSNIDTKKKEIYFRQMQASQERSATRTQQYIYK